MGECFVAVYSVSFIAFSAAAEMTCDDFVAGFIHEVEPKANCIISRCSKFSVTARFRWTGFLAFLCSFKLNVGGLRIYITFPSIIS